MTEGGVEGSSKPAQARRRTTSEPPVAEGALGWPGRLGERNHCGRAIREVPASWLSARARKAGVASRTEGDGDTGLRRFARNDAPGPSRGVKILPMRFISSIRRHRHVFVSRGLSGAGPHWSLRRAGADASRLTHSREAHRERVRISNPIGVRSPSGRFSRQALELAGNRAGGAFSPNSDFARRAGDRSAPTSTRLDGHNN
mgnify:CR=1 FL=1